MLADRAWSAVLLFVALYLAALALVWGALPPSGLAGAQIAALGAVVVASAGAGALIDRGAPDVGLGRVHAARALGAGALVGAAVVGAGHALVLLATPLRHEPGSGLVPFEIAAIVLPAVVHEELLFRGWAFRKLAAWRPRFAILFSAAVFAALHGANAGVGLLALINIFLGGILLGLLVVRWGTLWAAIGAHLVWNLLSGPFLGHEVSGWLPRGRLLATVDPGPAWLTGGTFGIEGSVLMTLSELAAIAIVDRIAPRDRFQTKDGT